MDWEQLWLDEQALVVAVFPVYQVIAGIASHAGAQVRRAECSDSTGLAAIAFNACDGTEVWLANLTAEPRLVNVQGLGSTAVTEPLDTDTVPERCSATGGMAARRGYRACQALHRV